MLRTLVVSNFVDFRTTQILQFQEGAHFLIGANSSGKTALFELTRRCLSKKSNPKVSYIPDESKPAYIICNFEMNQDLANTVSNVMESKKDSSMSSSFEKTPQTKKIMYSCCFVNKNPSTGKQQLFKLVCVYDSPMEVENMRLYIQRFQLEGSVIKLADSYDEWKSDSTTNPKLAEQFVNLDKQIAADEGIGKAAANEGIGKAAADEGIEKAAADEGIGKAAADEGIGNAAADEGIGKAAADEGIGKAAADEGIGKAAADEGIEKAAADEGIEKAAADEGIGKAIDDLLNELEEQARSVKGIEKDIGENILRELDGVVVVTFPVRGHGPLQWNQNPEMGKDDGGFGTYRSVSDGAVIIHALLDSLDVDHQEADKTFKELISPNMFVFKKKEKQGNSSTSESNRKPDQEYEIVVEKQDHAVPLMKIPEGILEARHFSLLLAHKKYQTICLEEPGRGMHPPMVQRMRDLLLRKQKGKTLIVISHKPSMVNFWAFDRMFVSRSIFHEKKPYHSVRRVRSAMLRRYQEENLRKMLFSSSVLFIEGPTDRIVMGAVFDEILETDLNTLDSVRKVKIQKLQRLVTETNMIDIEGSTGYNPYRALSHQLSVPYLFLFDKDSVFISKPKVQLKNLKASQARLEIVRACLALADGKSIENFLEKEVVTQMSTKPGHSKGKKRKTEPVLKVKNKISISKQPASDIRTILKDMYLPENCFDAKSNTAATFALREAEDKNNMKTYSDRRIFIWKTGNIEDVIIKSIIDVEDDNEMMKLFNNIVKCETARPGKELLKEAILEIDQQKAQELARHLLKCDDIKNFFDFMANPPPLSHLNDANL